MQITLILIIKSSIKLTCINLIKYIISFVTNNNSYNLEIQIEWTILYEFSFLIIINIYNKKVKKINRVSLNIIPNTNNLIIQIILIFKIK